MYQHTNLTEWEDWESSIKSSEYVMVDFFATWCQPCKLLDQQIAKAAEKYPSLKIFKVDIDEAEEISDELEIENLPMVYLFKNGEQKGMFMGSRYNVFHEKVDQLMTS